MDSALPMTILPMRAPHTDAGFVTASVPLPNFKTAIPANPGVDEIGVRPVLHVCVKVSMGPTRSS